MITPFEAEPSDYLAEERARRFVYPAWAKFTQRLKGKAKQAAYYLGYDISKWQLTADPVIAQGQGMLYTFIRALYGLSVDTKFPLHWGTHKNVLPRGPYLYYLDSLDPYQQAQKLYETCLQNGGIGEMPPVVDIEGINNLTLNAYKIRQCVERVSELFGDVMIYTGYYVWRDEVKGDKAWASAYKLWIAGYPFSDWKPEYFETVKNYPPLIPAPWTKYHVWQFTSKLPASQYGVSGTYLDGNYASQEFYETYLADETPPPDPIGEEPTMQFITKYLVNIRSGPNTTYPDIGDLPAGYVLTALEIQATDNNSVWVRFDTGKWVALVHNGGGPYLNYHPAPPPAPVPVVLLQTVTNANLRWYNAVNGQGKPIMSMPPAELRPKFLTGSVIACKPGKVDCNGTVDYYEVMNGQHATPKTYTPPTEYTGWFVSELDVFEVQL